MPTLLLPCALRLSAGCLAACLGLFALAACSDPTAKPVSAKADASITLFDSGVDVGDDSADDAVPPDTIAVAQDVTAADSGDAVDGGGKICPGASGCACTKNDDCDGAMCIDTAEGKQCAFSCIQDSACPAGFTCKMIGATDGTFICSPKYVTICAPCKINADCQALGTAAACVDHGASGKFCGGACAADGDCPKGYVCGQVADPVSGAKSGQCLTPEVVTGGSALACSDDAGCAQGEACHEGKCAVLQRESCGCSPWAKASGLTTPCTVSNSFGTCAGARGCEASGLAACGAKTPMVETCNASDDDCNGKIDDLPATATCSKKAFLGLGSAATCTTDGDCASAGEACDGGICHKLIGECFGKPACLANGSMLCADVKTPKSETCNAEDDDCDGMTDEDFTWTHPVDGTGAAIGQACGVGPCTGGVVKCQDLQAAMCASPVLAVPEKCDGTDNDCDGITDDLACEDNDACTADQCNGASNKCTHLPTDCSDTNACTTDSCNGKTGACEHGDFTGSCSDDNACSVGDHCQSVPGGAPICLPGEVTAACNDANLCTDDGCEPALGCVFLPNAVTQTCYGADPLTIGIGECKIGVKYCANGTQSSCFGEVTPSGGEICDGLDNTCNGATDEACKASITDIGFSNAFAATTGNGVEVTIDLGPNGPTGTSTGKKQVELGILAWLLSLSN